MATLTSIQTLIKNPKTLISMVLVSGFILFLIFIIILQYKNKTTQPQSRKQTQPDTAFGLLPYPEFIPKTLQHKVKEIAVNLQNQPALPANNNGKVYKLIQNTDTLPKIHQIALGFNFTEEPTKNQDFLSWSKEDRSLTFDTKTSRLNFTATFNKNQERTTSSQEDAENSAIKWLTKLDLLLPENQIKVNSLKTEGLNFISEPDETIAEAYQVAFFETLDGYPVYGQSPRTGTVTVIIDKAGNLIKLSARIIQVEQSQTASYLLKNTDQASTEVKREGVVVETEIPGIDPLIGEILNIKNISLTDLKYAYFKNINLEYIMPIYVFEGDLVLADGREGRTTVYLPAIENRFLQSSQP